jgi:RNA polymerase sigma factor (sigma-70 family)
MRTGTEDEGKLVDGCIRQEKEAWDAFVERYHRLISHSIVQTLRRYCVPLEDQIIEDLFHTVFLSLMEDDFKKLRQFKWKCSLSSWLHLIGVRTTIDYLRKESKDISLNGETEDEMPLKNRLMNGNPLPDELVEHEEEKAIFEKMKKTLTKREQFFMELYYSRELSPRQISKIMNTSENNVYQLKSLVRRKMEKVLEKFL